MQSRQQRWITDLLEGMPSLAFFAVWRGLDDLELAGWIGTVLAIVTIAVLKMLKTESHPVLLGVNIHMICITPIIVGLYLIGAPALAEFFIEHANKGVLVSVFVVGAMQTYFRKSGFIGSLELPKPQRLSYSLLLLLMSFFGMVWALSIEAGSLVTVVMPLTVLALLRGFLLARWQDRNNVQTGLIYAGAPAASGGSSDVS